MDKSLLDSRTSQGNEELSEENVKKMTEDTLQKWLLLQKTVKEEITLEDIILNQQKEDFTKLKKYFKQFYDLKLSSRKIYEDIRELKTLEGSKKNDIKRYYIEEDVDKILLQACEPITNLLFLFRNNYDYIIKLISLIDYQDEKEQIESLVELFCNQFYDNILIPNPEQEELLILIYKLLEEEITPMNSALIDEFLHDSTFLGKFISSFMKRQELNVFLSILLNPLIASIENEDDECLDMSLFSIQNFIKNKKKKEEFYSEQSMFNDIPKTKIHFKKNLQIEAEKAKENRRSNYNMKSMEANQIKNNLKISDKNNIIFNKDEKNEINYEYLDQLTQDILTKKLYEIKDNNDLKDFYEHQLEQIDNDPDIFSNKGLIDVLNEQCFVEQKDLIFSKYKRNFLFIQNKVDTIIQALIDNITSIPYTIRCISKIISLLISKKFPLLSKYLQNAFIGKFIFNKYIFPVLSLENKNVVENIIFSQETKKCLNVIISVISTANKCLLYSSNTDTEKTIFNYYLIEIIPILNKFYEKLIDIELPKALNDLVSQTKDKMDENIDNSFFSFRRKKKKAQTDNIKSKIEDTSPLYEYFCENSDEILQLQCICFCLNDIFFIINLINKNKNVFKGLPKYDSFIRAVEKIQAEEYKLDKQLNEEKEEKRFFVIYKDEKNSQLEKLFKQKNHKIKDKNISDKDLICIKIKDCIKTILKGLNVLNNKDYSYLNMATSNEKFLQAIQYSLEDIFEFSESENEIPLNWYGQFIANHKQLLHESYLENDLEKLYEELYNEETNILNELKSFSSIIITRDGMNLRCAEKILEKCKNDKRHIEKAKKFQKIENFIDKDKTIVCIRVREEGKIEKEKEKVGGIKGLFGKKEKEGKNEISYISVMDGTNCCHKNFAFMSSVEGEKMKKLNVHAENINEFISKFYSQNCRDFKIMLSFIEKDINKGEPNHQIYKAFTEYMELLKNSIKKTQKISEQKEIEEYVNKIEEYIMRKIYKNVFPKNELKEDKLFYEKTIILDWITPEQLGIKKLYVNQLGFALSCIKKLDEGKSVYEKINCIIKAQSNINNTIKFSTGKKENAGQDEITPILHYIIIKAHPRRIYSNINYIKCFLDKDRDGEKAFLVTQIECAVSYIINITHQQLNITKEEFDKNKEEARMKNK